MKVILFGQLKELAPGGSIDAPEFCDSGKLRHWLEGRLPLLNNLPYLLAIDRNIVGETISLESNQEIAILPPYSGG